MSVSQQITIQDFHCCAQDNLQARLARVLLAGKPLTTSYRTRLQAKYSTRYHHTACTKQSTTTPRSPALLSLQEGVMGCSSENRVRYGDDIEAAKSGDAPLLLSVPVALLRLYHVPSAPLKSCVVMPSAPMIPSLRWSTCCLHFLLQMYRSGKHVLESPSCIAAAETKVERWGSLLQLRMLQQDHS